MFGETILILFEVALMLINLSFEITLTFKTNIPIVFIDKLENENRLLFKETQFDELLRLALDGCHEDNW